MKKDNISDESLIRRKKIVENLKDQIQDSKTNFFKRALLKVRLSVQETKLELAQIGDNPNNIILVILIYIVLPYQLFIDFYTAFLEKHISSPFAREWLFAFAKMNMVSCLLILLMAVIKITGKGLYTDSWHSLLGWLFVVFPAIITLILSVVMRTPVLEFIDKMNEYPRISANMSIGSIDSFQTAIFGGDDLNEPLSELNMVVEESYNIFPVLLCCNILAEDAVPRSSLKQKPICFVTNYNVSDNEDDTPGVFVSNQMRFTKAQKSEYRISIKLLMLEDMIDFINELIELEPTMEFRYSYLKFSKLLLRIDPIEHYTYDEKVNELLNKINSGIHTWLQQK